MSDQFRSRQLLITIALLCFLQITASGQLKTGKIFNDGMVLQRDREISIWGWADAGDKVTITFNGKSYTAKQDKKGKWMATIPAMQAGGPYELVVSGKKEKKEIRDIWIGDVWVCSGQSNMEWPLAAAENAEAEIAIANDKMIRQFKVPLSSATSPEEELAGGEWKTATPEHAGQFTAVGYFFARELRKHYPNIPIGLINSSWGGSRLEPWMSAGSLGIVNPEKYFGDLKAKSEAEAAQKKQQILNDLGPVSEKDPGIENGKSLWADPDLNDSDWKDMKLPQLWEAAGYDGLDGIVWFRTTIQLTEEEAANGIELGLAKIDDSDMTWINGRKIGETIQAYSTARKYQASASQLKAGKNVITIRVEDTGGGGGIYGEEELFYAKTSKGKKPLSGSWKFKVGEMRFSSSTSDNQVPTLLYNKMIYPILDFPIKGVIWYQGESNANSREDAYRYRNLFATMINDWRQKWGVEQFPFLYVQLANYMAADTQPSDSYWALLRESQSATLSVPGTAQAVIIDIGEANDIHPKNKQDVGFRLSLPARKLAFGEDIVYSGPVYKNHAISGNRVIIEFDHLGSGLMVKNKYGYVNGFAVAGADKNFHWAQAKQEGDKIIVWSEKVENPVAVRYGWGNNPDDLNLYNKEGLPASPFRTDSW